ncbi:Ppx/GppA family phosphatase [Arcanobacterium haemolyticum]|nr:Ppx/GppA family phosphatase [Arcanobacterium haemolyticum]
MRVAGIDCGTNSIRLLIADVPEQDGLPTDVLRRMEVVRLGQGVDKTGEFSDEALARVFARVEEYAEECRAHGVESIRFAATSAARDARNKQIFLDGVRERLGVPVQILTGDEEAHTSFAGAASALGTEAPSPVIVVDLGGGSTEVVLGELAGGVISDYSMDVGCVRMAERHLSSDPADERDIAAIRADVGAMLDRAEERVDLGAARGLIGLAGTITTITAYALGLERYDSEAIHGATLPTDQIVEACEWFAHSLRSERAELGFMHPGRINDIPAGAIVWQEVIRRVAQRIAERGGELTHVMTSEHDILDGMAMWAAREPQQPDWV